MDVFCGTLTEGFLLRSNAMRINYAKAIGSRRLFKSGKQSEGSRRSNMVASTISC